MLSTGTCKTAEVSVNHSDHSQNTFSQGTC